MRNRIRQLLLVFAAALAFLLVFVGALYYISVGNNRTALIHSAKRQIDYASQQFAAKATSVETTAGFLSGTDAFRDFASQQELDHGSYDYMIASTSVQDTVANSLTQEPDVARVVAYWPATGNVVTAPSISQPIVGQQYFGGRPASGWQYTSQGLYYLLGYPYSGPAKSQQFRISLQLSNTYIRRMVRASGSTSQSRELLVQRDRPAYADMTAVDRQVVKDLMHQDTTWQEAQLTSVTAKGVSYDVFYQSIGTTGLFLVSYIPAQAFMGSINQVTGLMVLAIVILGLVGFFLILLFYNNVVKQLNILTRKFKRVENGDYTTRITQFPGNEFDYVFNQFNQMVGGAEHLLQSYNHEWHLRESAELRQYQAQINPHFLFNSLFYIISVAHDPEAVTEMTAHLARYYRYQAQKNHLVTVGDELSFANEYLSVMALRKQIRYTLDCPEKLKQQPILPLLLQPLIENAITHGIENKEGADQIVVRVQQQDEGLIFTVENDGAPLTDEETAQLILRINRSEPNKDGRHLGLWNVNQRLINFYGRDAGLRFDLSDLGGLAVTFRLPMKGGRTVESIARG